MHHRRRTHRALAAIAAVVGLTACGGDDDTSDSSDAAAAETTGAADAGQDGAEAGASAEITIADFAFGGPSEVAVGTTVTITNTDGVPHTWTATDGSFDSGSIGSGETFEFTFTEPGEFSYVCNFHPSMTGTIVVTG